MRAFLALTLFAAACSSSSPEGGPSYDSVRDRLADGQTRMLVASAASTGSITAKRRTGDGWTEGTTPVTIESGEVAAKVDAKGNLTVDTLSVSLADIEIPEDVFKKPAQLTALRVSLPKPVTADATTWTSDDDATTTLTVALDFDWAIHVNGGTTPLATQHMPPVTVDVMLTGAGDHIDATASLSAAGELWNWADLIEMTKLDLSLSASTND